MNGVDPEVAEVVANLLERILVTLDDRCMAVYQMGSLARGGFSRATSDIDVGVIVTTPSDPEEGRRLNAIAGQVTAAHPGVSNPISVFWGSVADLNGLSDSGRYPPFDRLDLIDHARLLAGREVRDQLIRPSRPELVDATAAFALELVLTERLLGYVKNPAELTADGIRSVTKLCLFPARFVYLLDTGAVAGNAESARHAAAQLSGPAAQLVLSAHAWRSENPDHETVTGHLAAGLCPLYLWFLEKYQVALEDPDLRLAMARWGQRIAEAATEA